MKTLERDITMHPSNARARLIPHATAVLVLCLALIFSVSPQTEKKQLTLEWIFGPEGRSVTSLPSTTWLDDGTLIMLDSRRPAKERTFEKLDPATGVRHPIIDPEIALTIMNSRMFGLKVESLSWPIAFDGAGERAL